MLVIASLLILASVCPAYGAASPLLPTGALIGALDLEAGHKSQRIYVCAARDAGVHCCLIRRPIGVKIGAYSGSEQLAHLN